MNSELLSIISNIAWCAIKDGVQLTYNALRKKLSRKDGTCFNEEEYKKIVEIVNQMPYVYRQNELLVEGYLQTNKDLLDILSKNTDGNTNMITQYSYGSGDNIGRDKVIKGNG